MYDKYLIQHGDTLRSIANKFNTDEAIIMELNNLPYPDMIREGREIIVPLNKEQYFDYYTIKQGDNLYAIARKYNINPDLLALLNGIEKEDYIYPNQEILIPKKNFSYYVTTEGDTLELISKKFSNTPNEIINENKTIYLLPGQLLVKKN